MFGQAASWQTVCRPSRFTSAWRAVYCGPMVARVLIHSGLRSIGVAALRASMRSSLRPSGAVVSGRAAVTGRAYAAKGAGRTDRSGGVEQGVRAQVAGHECCDAEHPAGCDPAGTAVVSEHSRGGDGRDDAEHDRGADHGPGGPTRQAARARAATGVARCQAEQREESGRQPADPDERERAGPGELRTAVRGPGVSCLLYTSDAADEED